MFRHYFLLLFLIVSVCIPNVSAQQPSRISIRGILQDTSGSEVVTATVMLLNPADSTLVSFTASDKNGTFRINNVKNDEYLLKVSHVSYMPLQISIEQSRVSDVNLGEIALTPFSQVLMQVVVREAKAPIRIHGDTIEYDVSTFKVPPGSTVEDLLKKLPGIEVDASGNISAQGKNVRRIFVDGKSFFGDDPKTVTQNLGSEAIKKVQVYDERSEQTRLTGVPDASQDKAMNLELKEEYKKGSFGKATVAGGTENRWAVRGNFNRFDDKKQFSVIGYGNNINQSGVNWDDYREFKGQAGFSDYDNGDFGFLQGYERWFRPGSVDVPISRDSDRGFSDNAGIGTNYNFDNNKSKVNASYFYSQSTLYLEQQTFRRTFLPNSSYLTRDTLDMTDFRGNHNISSRFEHQFDSTSTLIARINGNIVPVNTSNLRSRYFSSESDIPVNYLLTDNSTENLSLRMNSLLIFGKKLKKDGRSFAISGAYIYNSSNGEEDINSINRFFSASNLTEQIRQINYDINETRVYKGSALFTEGLSKKFFIEGFYNFSTSLQFRDNDVNNSLLPMGDQRIDSLSLLFRNNQMYNRLGTSVRFSHKGANLSVGIAAQNIDLTASFASDKEMPWSEPGKRSYFNFTPNVNLTQQFPNRMWLQASYSYNINPPLISDLFPRPVINNPLFITEGNPNLSPEKQHTINSMLSYWAPSNFASYGAYLDYNIYKNRIVYNLFTEFIDSTGYRTVTKPENTGAADNFSSSFWSSVPLVKTVLTLNMRGGFNTGNSVTYINNVMNETGTTGYSGSLGFNLTPGNVLQFSLNGSVSFSNISYSIQSNQDQKIENHQLSATIRLLFLKKTFFESNFNYTLYKNDRFSFDQTVPLWNASVRRIFGAKNRIEARIAVFDVFNKRLFGITQTGSENYIMYSKSNTLARYFMLSVSYNIRGYDLKMQQGGRRSFF